MVPRLSLEDHTFFHVHGDLPFAASATVCSKLTFSFVHITSSSAELLSSSPTLLGEDASFRCQLRDALVLAWKINGTFLPSPHYNATPSRVNVNGTIYEILTVQAELSYNMSEIECGVPFQQWSEDCVPVYLIVKGLC